MGDVSYSSNLGYKLIKNYYETAHAKDPQDAAGGFLKNQADYAVLRGKATIQCAKDLYKFAEENLQQPKCKNGNYKRRIFRYVESIPRDNNRNFKPVSQNRKVHQIISENGSGELISRDLSCYDCDKCFMGDIHNCKNIPYIGGSRKIKMQFSNITSVNEDIEEDTNSNDLISRNFVVAVLADDPEYEYYLLKVTDEPQMAKRETCDAWGCTFQPGSVVVKGYYYDRVSSKPFLYTLVQSKIAICHAAVVYW